MNSKHLMGAAPRIPPSLAEFAVGLAARRHRHRPRQAARGCNVIRLKAIGVVALIWLAVFYFAIAIYGRFSSVGTKAWYSSEVDATCIVEKRIDQMAMSCLPGDRITEQQQGEGL